MSKLEIKYRLERQALPPRPIRVELGGWGGSPELKKVDGSQPQPWHCPLHVEGCTHGVELLFQYDIECHIVNDGKVRIEWQGGKEPGGTTGTGDFKLSVPRPPANYLFATSIDLQAPPGYVLRTEPHPRFFADMTGTAPAAMYGHIRSEWWPKQLFMVFKIPAPGERHIFRKGEPYAQILFIPDDDYEIRPMTPEEVTARRNLENDIRISKSLLARHVWHNADGTEFNDHYRVLARTYERDGVAGVEKLVRQAMDKYRACVPKDKTAAEYFDLARQRHAERRFTEAKELLHHLMRLDPNNPEVYYRIGMLEWDLGVHEDAIRTMRRAVALMPTWPYYHNQLGELLRRVGRLEEAEAAFRESVRLNPNDPEALAILGFITAQRGRVAEGLERCRDALSMRPNVPSPYFVTGLILAGEGQTAAARSQYETALGIDPEFTAAREALKKLGSAPVRLT